MDTTVVMGDLIASKAAKSRRHCYRARSIDHLERRPYVLAQLLLLPFFRLDADGEMDGCA